MYTLRLVVGTNFRDYGFGGYNFSDSEPGNKNTTRGLVEGKFPDAILRSDFNDGETIFLENSNVTALLASASFSEDVQSLNSLN